MPPAFVLSQDQTLRKINYFIRKSDSKHLNCVVLTTSISRCLKLNFQGYIALFNFQSATTFLWCLIIYHSLFRLSSELLKIFEIFLISVSFISSGPCGPQRCETLLNISSIFVLSNYFLKIFDFFHSAVPRCLPAVEMQNVT